MIEIKKIGAYQSTQFKVKDVGLISDLINLQ